MADKKKQTVILTSPVGVVGPFAKLVTPDDYQGQNAFKLTLFLSEEDAEVITSSAGYKAALAEAQEMVAEKSAAAKSKGKRAPAFSQHDPFFAEVDRDTGEDTGRLGFKFKSSAEWTNKKTGQVTKRVIPFFSAAGKAIPKDERPEPWGGSRVRVGYSVNPYAMDATGKFGVSLRLEALKLIELRTKGSGGDASRFGMDQEEDGYEPDEGGAAGTMGGDESDGSGSSDDGETPPRF